MERSSVFAVIYERHAVAVMRVCAAMLSGPQDTENAAHDAFETAFRWLAEGRPLEHPDQLRAWLCGIARNSCRRQWDRRARQGEMPGTDISDDDLEAASRRRLVQVDRMLDAVAASFTEPQQRLFRLAIREGLVGARLAEQLGVSAEVASRQAYGIIQLAHTGFGALVLARDGRSYCPGLARILDEAGWHGDDFSHILRQRIIRHISDCQTCDNCVICKRAKSELVRPYAPAVIPLLIAASLRERVMDSIRRVAEVRPFDNEPDRRPPAAPPAPPATSHATQPAVPRSVSPRQPSQHAKRSVAITAVTLLVVAGLIAAFHFATRSQSSVAFQTFGTTRGQVTVTGNSASLTINPPQSYAALWGAQSISGPSCGVTVSFEARSLGARPSQGYGYAVTPRETLSADQPSGTSVQFEWDGASSGFFMRPVLLPAGAWQTSIRSSIGNIGQWHHVTVHAAGISMTVSFDNGPAQTFTGGTASCGRVGFRVWGGPTEFRNIVIRHLD